MLHWHVENDYGEATGGVKVRQQAGWMNSWTGGREFNVSVINLNFVSQWQFNLISCQPLLTKIRVLRSVWEEQRGMWACTRHKRDKSQLQQRANAPRGEDRRAPQVDLDVKLFFNLCTEHRTDGLSLKDISRSVSYLIKMRVNNSSVHKVFPMKNSHSIVSLSIFPQNCCESLTVDSLFSPGRDWPHPLHVCATTFVIKFFIRSITTTWTVS